MKNLLFLAFISLVFSCSSVRHMQINVPKPTLVPLPAEVKRLAIVDKTEGNVFTAVEGVLTGEMLGIDKVVSQECLSGIKNPFLNNSDIKIVQHSERLKSENKTSTGFGAVMDNETVQALAKENEADALLVVEYFDSDFSIRDIGRINNQGPVQFRGYARAKAGIRIYLPKSKTLFYENSFSNERFYGESAPNKTLLLGKILTGTNALKSVSYDLGQAIARRFVSYRIWEPRVILKSKNEAAKRAERMIVALDFDNAIATLERLLRTEGSSSLRAAMGHNLAYYYEVKGDLQLARKWLTEAYVASGSKKSQQYLEIINRRIREEELIEAQRNGAGAN